MNDEYRKQLLEQREEIEMMLLMDEYLESEGAMLLKDFEEADKRGEIPEIPEDLDERCRQIIHNSFAKQEQKRTLTRITKYIGKVAVYVLLFLGVASTLILSVDALRIPVLNFFIEKGARGSNVVFKENSASEEMELEEITSSIQTIVPEEYTLVSEVAEPVGTLFLCFQNPKGNVLVIQMTPLDGMLNIDTEDSESEEIEVNGYMALLVKKEGLRVVWGDTEKKLMYSVFADTLDESIFWNVVYALAS